MDYLERVASDAAMRRRLRLARTWGVTRPTVALGDPVVTVHHYADSGRLVTSQVAGWSEEDVAWAEALDAYEARLCPRGHDTAVSMRIENTFESRVHTLGACHFCHAGDVESGRWKDHDLGPSMLYGVAHVADPDCVHCNPRE